MKARLRVRSSSYALLASWASFFADPLVAADPSLIPVKPSARKDSAAAPLQGADPSSTFPYPELEVAPRASERLASEAKLESSTIWTRQAAVQTSAAMTLISAVLVSGASAKKGSELSPSDAATVGFIVGLGWQATTVLMALAYEPYRDGAAEIKKLSGDRDRDVLARERAAEERLNSAAALGRKLDWLSVASNLAANAVMASTTDDQFIAAVAGLSALAAFAPLVFPARWQRPAELQEEYKKRIYGPLRVGLFPTPVRTDDGHWQMLGTLQMQLALN